MENEFLKINIKQGTAHGKFRVVCFDDHGHKICFVPSLNLSAYGESFDGAKKMLGEIVLKDFIENLLDLPESRIYEELQKLGWERNPIFKKELSSKVHIDREGILRNFNLSEETEIYESVVAL